ncbi:MAG: helix-hairpin-helix domain-containing protein [Longimicrobiales bacterium]
MDGNAIAVVLEEIGSLLDLTGENKFKARAFSAAARAIEKADASPTDLAASGALESLTGIGPVTAKVVRELVTTGRSGYYDDLRARTPAGLKALLSVPGLGAKKAKQLYDALGVASLEDLEAAVDEGRIAGVKGFGERTQQRIAAGIKFVHSGAGRRRLSRAVESAERILGVLRALPGVERAEITGELRRRLETVDGVDIVASADAQACSAAVDAFMQQHGLLHQRREGERLGRARLADGLEVRFVCVPPETFTWALWLHTGSPEHVAAIGALAHAQGLSLSPAGISRGGDVVALTTEADLYDALGIQYVEPELREAGGHGGARIAVDLSVARALPRLVEYTDLRGCFHCHTTYSDGKATLKEMAEGAIERGWEFLGIADHSQNASYAGGLKPSDIERQHREIAAWNEERGTELWLLKGIEADILADGTLDYSANAGVLESFDYVIGSVHSNFRMSKNEMTQRLLRALDDPRLTIMGHMTGRLLLSRDAYALDVEKVIRRAADRGVAIEINADPARLDLDWRWWQFAKQAGVLCAINPDAHSVRSLDNTRWGVDMARKGGLAAADVINTRDRDGLRSWLQGKHG